MSEVEPGNSANMNDCLLDPEISLASTAKDESADPQTLPVQSPSQPEIEAEPDSGIQQPSPNDTPPEEFHDANDGMDSVPPEDHNSARSSEASARAKKSAEPDWEEVEAEEAEEVNPANSTFVLEESLLARNMGAGDRDQEKQALQAELARLKADAAKEADEKAGLLHLLKEFEQSCAQMETELAELKSSAAADAAAKAAAVPVSSSASALAALEMKDVETLRFERDQAMEDVGAMETSLADVNRRYERLKRQAEKTHRNEVALREALKNSMEQVRLCEERHKSLVAHTKAEIDKSSAEIARLKKLAETETLSLRAQVKRHELTQNSLRQQLAQTSDENKSLSALCDELIKRADK